MINFGAIATGSRLVSIPRECTTGFHIMKGYMDTIPKALDEAAMIDGCTRW